MDNTQLDIAKVQGPYSQPLPITRASLKAPFGLQVVYPAEMKASMTVSFSGVDEATSYQIQVTDNVGEVIHWQEGQGSSITTPPTIFSIGTMYTVQVRGVTATIRGAWSAPVTITPAILGSPSISSVTNEIGMVEVALSTVVGANSYTAEIFDAQGVPLDPPLIVTKPDTRIPIPATRLSSGDSYRIKVRADIINPAPTGLGTLNQEFPSNIRSSWSDPYTFVWQSSSSKYHLLMPRSTARMVLASAPQYEFGASDFTIELVVNIGKIRSGWLVYRLSDDGLGRGAGFGLRVDESDNVIFIMSDAAGNTFEYAPYQRSSINDGKQHHVVARRQSSHNSTVYAIYVDGKELRGFRSSQAPVDITTVTPITYGAPPNTSGPTCYFRDLRLWARALTDNEIRHNMTGTPASRDSLVGEWLFNNASTADTSGYRNTGELQNFARPNLAWS